MTSRAPSWCNFCLHYEGYSVCRAFPGGIPDDIVFGTHLTPVPGDGGTTFMLDPAQRYAFEDVLPYLPAATPS